MKECRHLGQRKCACVPHRGHSKRDFDAAQENLEQVYHRSFGRSYSQNNLRLVVTRDIVDYEKGEGS